MIYKDYAREYEKYKLLKAEEVKDRRQKDEEEKDSMVKCLHCSKLISHKLKVCIYCHGKILNPFELLLHNVFTAKNTVVFFVVVFIAVVVVLITYPQIAKR